MRSEPVEGLSASQLEWSECQDDDQRGERTEQRSAVAEHSDRDLPPELKPVVQGVPEAVRPMKQHEDDKAEQDQPGEPVADHSVQMAVVGLHLPYGNGSAEQ